MSGDPKREAPPRSARPVGASRYGWVVGVVAVIVIAYISLNTLRTDGPGSVGPAPGTRLPPFAAPLVTSDLDGDANIATRSGQGKAGPVPACDVDDPRALNVCTLSRSRPVALTFLTKDDTCVRESNAFQALSRAFPRVAFAAVGLKGGKGEYRDLARERGWTFPIAHDHDGAVWNVYGVAVCPTVVLAYRGGEVMETVIGDDATSPRALAVMLRRLERGPPEPTSTAGGEAR